MCDCKLIPFWIDGSEQRGPLGFGVTAFSVEDALEIVRRAGYELPRDVEKIKIRSDIKVADIEHRHVRERMGPIVVRGLWYPFLDVGLAARNRP